MCILFHDYEEFNDTNLIKHSLHLYLMSLGFVLNTRNLYNLYNYYHKNDIRIYEWDCDNVDTIESCILCSPKTKVCVKCGKIKINYNIDDCKSRLDDIIHSKIKGKEKTRKALSILECHRD